VHYCTTSVTVVVWTSVPEVPVTVTVKVPAGVLVLEPIRGNPPPEQPLMYPTEIRSTAKIPIGASFRIEPRLNFARLAVASARSATKLISHSGRSGVVGRDGGNDIPVELRAVVVIVIDVLVPALTDVGLKVAAAPVGRPLAVNVTVPGNAPPTAAVAIAKFAGPPAVTVCDVVVALTLKSVMVSVSELDVPPPGVGFTTVIAAVPGDAMSAAVIAAVNWVALTNVVVRGLPFQFAVDPFMKLVPVSVNVNAAPPAPVVAGEIAVSVGTGFGAVIVKVSALDVVPLG
jgi:hypothetical protein